MSASNHFDFWICYRGPKNKKYVFFYFSPFSYLGGENCVQSLGWKIIFVEKMDFLKIWWVSHISHSKTQNSSIDTIPLSLIVLEISHKNDFSTLTLNAVFTPQIWKPGKNKKTRISYFSVLYNISKNRNDRRRTPQILSLLEVTLQFHCCTTKSDMVYGFHSYDEEFVNLTLL